MPRIRSIKPETFDDPDLAAVSLAARWVFVGLWTQADRDGRLEDDPRRLKNRLLPYEPGNFPAILDELTPRFITRYTVDGRNYIQVNNFAKHQRFHKDEKASGFPPPPPKPSGQPGNFPAKSPVSCLLSLGTGDLEIGVTPQPPQGAIAPVLPNHHKPLTVDEVFYSDEAPTPAPVADLAERWTKIYAECRHGATYRPHPVHDYGVFVKLVQDYPDPSHLDEMIRFFFLATDLPSWASTRSPKCFLRLAPETDAAVREGR